MTIQFPSETPIAVFEAGTEAPTIDAGRLKAIEAFEDVKARVVPDFARRASAAASPPRKFTLETWSEITFDLDEEWLVKHIFPQRGVGLIFGKSGSFKSFLAMHIGLCIALGRPWAGRRVTKATVVYIGAEAAAGLRKRKVGYVKAWRDLPAERDLPEEVDFHLISATPNLGTVDGDLAGLVASIGSAGIRPGLIVIDTVAKAIGAADENGAGMAAFLGNAEGLAKHFECFVLAVHHVGLGEDAQKRPRGHSGLTGALDVQILCERANGAMKATLALQKEKDEASDVLLAAHLSRVVLGHDKDGEEVSTLIVDDVAEQREAVGKAGPPRPIPKAQRLLMDVIVNAIKKNGEDFRPEPDGGKVRAVADRHVRELYFDRVAEKADPDEDKKKLFDRQRNAFKRALKAAIDARILVAANGNGERLIWLP